MPKQLGRERTAFKQDPSGLGADDPLIRDDRVFDYSVVVGISEVELIAMDFDPLGIIKYVRANIRSARPYDPNQGSSVLTCRVDHQNPVGILVGNNQPAKIIDV